MTAKFHQQFLLLSIVWLKTAFVRTSFWSGPQSGILAPLTTNTGHHIGSDCIPHICLVSAPPNLEFPAPLRTQEPCANKCFPHRRAARLVPGAAADRRGVPPITGRAGLQPPDWSTRAASGREATGLRRLRQPSQKVISPRFLCFDHT